MDGSEIQLYENRGQYIKSSNLNLDEMEASAQSPQSQISSGARQANFPPTGTGLLGGSGLLSAEAPDTIGELVPAFTEHCQPAWEFDSFGPVLEENYFKKIITLVERTLMVLGVSVEALRFQYFENDFKSQGLNCSL